LVEILSQSEIDMLIRAIQSGEATEETLQEQPKQKIRPYDFRNPDKFSKEQINTFQVIYDNYARLVSTFLSVNLRSNFHVALLSIEQVSYGEFIISLLDPSISILFNMDPMEGTAIFEISPEVMFALLERLMGGRGQKTTHLFRSLTEIERTLIENLCQEILDLSCTAWSNIINFHPKIEHIETNPQFVQVVAPTETVLLVSLELKIDNVSGVLQFIFPYIVLEPILDKFSTKHWFAKTSKVPGSDYRNNIRMQINSVRIPVSVILGDATVTVRELMELQSGDVVMLNRKKDQQLDVWIGGSKKYLASPGLHDHQLAVKITSLPEEETENANDLDG